jgi:NAD+ synthase (glutamine-hydrolysing)
MRIAIAQINSTLGAFSANAEKILNEIERARGKNSDLVVFPECALFGYHPFDLLEQQNG